MPADPVDELAQSIDGKREDAVRKEDLEPTAAQPDARPERKFIWVDETDFTIESLIAGKASATLDVFKSDAGSLQLTFRELLEDDKAAVDAYHAPMVKTSDVFFSQKQLSRSVVIGEVASAITKWDGKSWFPKADLAKKITALRKDRSQVVMDKILQAWLEFMIQLEWLARQIDPKAS